MAMRDETFRGYHMKKITKTELDEILRLHKLWLAGDPLGARAILSNLDLRGADLSYDDLSYADLYGADLSYANLYGAILRNLNLRGAFLYGSDLCDANLRGAILYGSNLCDAILRGTILYGADLSGTKGLIIPSEYIAQHFERVKDGYIGYKTFGGKFPPPVRWAIKPGEIITETVNPNRTDNCGSGINIAPLDWVKGHYQGDIWQVLIRWEWLADVVVPYNTDGKIRCGKVELVKIVDRG